MKTKLKCFQSLKQNSTETQMCGEQHFTGFSEIFLLTVFRQDRSLRVWTEILQVHDIFSPAQHKPSRQLLAQHLIRFSSNLKWSHYISFIRILQKLTLWTQVVDRYHCRHLTAMPVEIFNQAQNSYVQYTYTCIHVFLLPLSCSESVKMTL